MRTAILLPLLLGLAVTGCTGGQLEPTPTMHEEDAQQPATTAAPAPVGSDANGDGHDQDASATHVSTVPTVDAIDTELPTTGFIDAIIPTIVDDATSPACGYTLFDDLGNGRAMFVTGSAELTDHAHEALQLAAAEILQSPPNADRTPDVQPVGHADPTPLLLPDGSDGNEELSRLRAVAVRDALIALDVPPHRIAEPEGMGATKLIDEGTDPESLGRNRRVELIVACESSP